MATIDDLWDQPVESEPAPRLATKPAAFEGPLFLQSDSENEGGPSLPRKAPDDIGALFEVDDDDNEGEHLSNVTYEQLRKDAQLGGKVPDDGPLDEGNQENEEALLRGASTAEPKLGKKGGGGDGENTKGTIPKLDEELLLSDKGIPSLIKDAKHWQPKGKGHEISDLNRLIRVYQYWAHQMYPRHTFNDTIERVEKLTHSRRMHVALGGWHDAARGISRHQAPPEESIDIDGIDSDEEESQARPSTSRRTSEPPTRPPSSASERTSGPGDDFYMGGAPGIKPTGTQGGGNEFDFEVEMWDDTVFTGGPTSTPTNATNSANNPPGPSTNPPAPSPNQDEDEDMWDLVDELQQAQAKRPDQNTVSPGAPPAPAEDDDWDDMYA